MEAIRQATVLFADVSESTKLYETAGDAAAHAAILGCLEQLKMAAERSGGRVVKTIGDAVLALFPTPDTAASGACAMHTAVEALPAVGETRLGVRIALHSGKVIDFAGDLFGDTVNIASRLAEQAGKGQILTSQETAELLGPAIRSFTRRLYTVQLKGKSDELELCEIVWRRADDVTNFRGFRAPGRPVSAVLRLRLGEHEVLRRRQFDSVTLGRNPDCGLVVHEEMASRQHCSIERRLDKFVLRDHSTNGTYVTVAGDSEVLLQREEFTLRRNGWISLGQSRTLSKAVVEYFCE
jgi:adenylate cyclase